MAGYGAPAQGLGYAPSAAAAFPAPAPAATRAESWALGALPSSATGTAGAGVDRNSPSPSGRTWTSVEPHQPRRRENRWMFPILLVVLGAGGLVLGGVLGKTWIARMMNTTQTSAPASDPSLPPFAPMEANAALERAQAEAVNCLGAETTPLAGLVVARFSTNGSLEFLQMNGTLGTASEAPCVRSVFEKVHVSAFSGPPAQVEKSLELRPRP